MTTTTFQDAAQRIGTSVPAHLEAQAAVPVVTSWRQGDLYIRSEAHPVTDAMRSQGHRIDGAGYQVVRGEADRNSHILNGTGLFIECKPVNRLTDYGLLLVGPGEEAVLTHTDEHGSVAFGEGIYRVWGQVSHEAELRRAAD